MQGILVWPNAEAAGSQVTLTAQVSGGNPTGAVYFLVNGVIVATTALNADDSAGVSVGSLPTGVDALEAVHSGDEINAPAVSSPFNVTVAAQ